MLTLRSVMFFCIEVPNVSITCTNEMFCYWFLNKIFAAICSFGPEIRSLSLLCEDWILGSMGYRNSEPEMYPTC